MIKTVKVNYSAFYAFVSFAMIISTSTFAAQEPLRGEALKYHLQKFGMNELHMLSTGEITEREAVDQFDKLRPEIIEEKIDQQDNDGYTPLHLAVQKNYYKLAQSFMRHGANVNIPNNFGSTALHAAAMNNNHAMVNALILGGARTDVVNKKGLSPYQLTTDRAIRERLAPAKK